MDNPVRGENWLIDLNPTRGHEQGGRRPGLVVSVDLFNKGPAGLVIVLPITTKEKGIPYSRPPLILHLFLGHLLLLSIGF